ncbi:MAG: hypothetical protein J0H96_12000 [Microbacterium ginsengisoli]|mgnify:CR=1 FL=1|jgi:hypothetical protein|nr:hypothetical protein [Microbacterium ginsengisoli]
MGTSKRYADHFDQLGAERDIARLAERYPLQTLTKRELELDVLPVTTNPRPEKVRAWVRFGPEPVRVSGEAVMWTDVAVAVRFHAQGREYRCWVWSSAVMPAVRSA